MSNMSSFYGGRSGAPFTIVKTFDAIDLDSFDDKDKPVCTKTYYALSEDGKNFEITGDADTEGAVSVGEGHFIIKKTNKNYLKHNWKIAINNGSPVNGIEGYKFPKETAEGMVQLFSKGINSLEEVNYQEYVLIDTVTRMNDYSNPDNGKLYRRGMNLDNGMEGAEYIGRIIGPQGFNTGIQAGKFSDIENLGTDISISKGTIVSELIAGNELTEENDGIKYIYANILDKGGNVLETKIGFKFPYLVNTFKSKLVTPYEVTENENLITETKENGEILQNSTDNLNPFYRHWSIKIPNGKKGDSVELIRKQPTLAPKDINYYTSLANLRNNESAGKLLSSETISSDKYLVDREGAYIQLDTNKFVKVEDCTNNKVFYVIRDYNERLEGSLSIPIEIGDIASIVKTKLDNNGTLTIYYDNGKEEKAENKIKWINNVRINTDGDNPNYKLHVTYNTKKSDSDNNEEEDIGESISYIKNLQVKESDKKLYATYNIKDNILNKEEAISDSIRWIEDLQVNSGEKGNQKLCVTYNTPNSNGNLSEDIGVPINFIKELHIGTVDDNKINNKVKPNCLYVRYSDPNFYANPEQYIIIDNKEWVELGILTPPVQGLKILKEYSEDEFNEIKNIPPEVLFENTAAYGGAITVAGSMHIFDYLTNQWTDTKIVIGEAHTILDNYVTTNTNNDNNFLINNNKSALSDTLPLKLNQEDIASSSSVKDFNNIDKQGIYSIQKELTFNKPPIEYCIDSSLIVLKVNNIIYQIFIKNDNIYSRYRNSKNSWTSWKNNIDTDFIGSKEGEDGKKGLVPAPLKTEIDNYFLKSNGEWTSLNTITFNGAPTFDKGFTSQGTTASTFANAVSITASDPTGKKALTVTNGISAASISASGNISTTGGNISTDNGDISATGNGKFGSINIGNTTVINSSCGGNFASISTTGDISATGVGSFNSISINKKEGNETTEVASINSTGSGDSFNVISIKKKESNGGITEVASINNTGTGNFNDININKVNNISKASISNAGIGSFASINIGNTEVISNTGIGKFTSISATGNISTSKGDISTDNGNITATGSISTDNGNIIATGKISTSNGDISASGNGKFGSINIGDKKVISSSYDGDFASITASGNISTTEGDISTDNGTVSANILSITSKTDIDYKQNFNNNTTCAARIAGGLYVQHKIKSDDGVFNAVWNDLADSIVVNKDAEIEAGYCYCLKDNKYIKSSKYLDNGIIGIHSDTYGFKMGEKIGEKQLDCAVAGFVLAYVDKDYLPGTALTCTKDGHLTKIKSKDKQRFPEKVIATYWKDEPAEEWGSDNRKVKVNGRKWVKIK